MLSKIKNILYDETIDNFDMISIKNKNLTRIDFANMN